MEMDVKRSLKSKPFGIVEKLGWSSRKLSGRFPTIRSSSFNANPITNQTAKDQRDFLAEFECKRAQGLIVGERARNMLIR